VEVVAEYYRPFVWRDVSGIAEKECREGIPMSYSTVLGPWIIRGPNKPYETGRSKGQLLPIWEVFRVETECMRNRGRYEWAYKE
jgi:hypothetical protein